MLTTKVISDWSDGFIYYGGRGLTYEQEYPDIPGVEWPYGVCDSPEQFVEKYGELLRQSKRTYYVEFRVVTKAEQPSKGGWRWYKWGPYVGNLQPAYEYLYDEPDIERVCCYHIYDLTQE